jgi:hypothetical protein
VFRLNRQGWKDDMLDDLAADRANDIHRAGEAGLRGDVICFLELVVHNLAGIGMDAGESGDSQDHEEKKEREKTAFHHIQGSF